MNPVQTVGDLCVGLVKRAIFPQEPIINTGPLRDAIVVDVVGKVRDQPSEGISEGEDDRHLLIDLPHSFGHKFLDKVARGLFHAELLRVTLEEVVQVPLLT